jgi:hypothetical protein
MKRRTFVAGMALPVGLALPAPPGHEWEAGFRRPPHAARPWVYWF